MEITDTQMLDFLDKYILHPGEGWILRQSVTNRNLRLHVSTKEELLRIYGKYVPLYKTAREAIAAHIMESHDMDFLED